MWCTSALLVSRGDIEHPKGVEPRQRMVWSRRPTLGIEGAFDDGPPPQRSALLTPRGCRGGGPLCTMLLGDCGAEVMKIEPLPRGVLTRSWDPSPKATASNFFNADRSERSVALDFRDAEAPAALAAWRYSCTHY